MRSAPGGGENMKCPKCGKEFDRLLALSREDNKTMICDDCGVIEALDAAGFPKSVTEETLKAIHDLQEEGS